MAESFQKEKPPSRNNIFLDVETGGARKKMELPMRLMVLGDFTMKESGLPLEERKRNSITKDNFQEVMGSHNLSLDFNVKDHLAGGDNEMKVNLSFKDLNSFHPEAIAKQVPQLGKLLATRNLLQDLRDRIINKADFRKKLEEIIKDKAALAKLTQELEKLTPPDEGGEKKA